MHWSRHFSVQRLRSGNERTRSWSLAFYQSCQNFYFPTVFARVVVVLCFPYFHSSMCLKILCVTRDKFCKNMLWLFILVYNKDRQWKWKEKKRIKTEVAKWMVLILCVCSNLYKAEITNNIFFPFLSFLSFLLSISLAGFFKESNWIRSGRRHKHGMDKWRSFLYRKLCQNFDLQKMFYLSNKTRLPCLCSLI